MKSPEKILRVIQKEDPVLRRVAEEVPLGEIGSKKINGIISKMTETLESCVDGVALAAPQIGESIRIFIVSSKAMTIGEEDARKGAERSADKLIYINPVITRKSSKRIAMEEGCLSVRGIFGKIKRHEKVTISAYDENGDKFTRGASGLLAEIFQHETDHLNGILFTDSATDLFKQENNQPEDAG